MICQSMQEATALNNAAKQEAERRNKEVSYFWDDAEIKQPKDNKKDEEKKHEGNRGKGKKG